MIIFSFSKRNKFLKFIRTEFVKQVQRGIGIFQKKKVRSNLHMRLVARGFEKLRDKVVNEGLKLRAFRGIFQPVK